MAPGSGSPGVLVFGGQRDAGNWVSIVWVANSKANVFMSPTDIVTTTVNVVPEPTGAFVLLLGLALRRRR